MSFRESSVKSCETYNCYLAVGQEPVIREYFDPQRAWFWPPFDVPLYALDGI